MPSQRPFQSLPTDELWIRLRRAGDPRVKEELVTRHLPLVRYVAERIGAMLPKSVELEDLIQAGSMGLMDAVGKFDHSLGIKFKTYCSHRIRGAILDALRSQDWVPRLVRQRATRLEAIQREWLGQYGRQPTLRELAEALDVAEKDVEKEVRKATPRVILHASDRKLAPGDETEGTIEALAESREPDPVEPVLRADILEAMTSRLTPKEKRIVYMYYRERLTLREIGARLNLTESRVCQIHSSVIERLRRHLRPAADQYPS